MSRAYIKQSGTVGSKPFSNAVTLGLPLKIKSLNGGNKMSKSKNGSEEDRIIREKEFKEKT